jgi:basic amino acid/polyamine antiporter, APA family
VTVSNSSATRRLGLASLVGLGINTIVGSAIFRLPAELSRELGWGSLLAIVGCALLLCPVALAYAEAGGMLDGDGGAYVYAREAFGARAGFAVGWSVWIATVLTLAAVASALSGQLAGLVPHLDGAVTGRALGVAVIGTLALLNVGGTRMGAGASSLLAIAKVLPLIAFVAFGLPHVEAARIAAAPVPTGRLSEAIGAALMLSFFAESGFEVAAIPAGAAERPQRNVPLAVIISMLGAALLYALIQLVVLGVLPAADASERPLSDAARVFGGPRAAAAMALLGAASIVGLMTAMAFAAPRLLTAMADRGELWPGFAARHPRWGTPHRAVVVSSLAAALLVVSLDFRALVDFTSVVLEVQYVATCAAVVMLRRTRPDAPRAVRLPFGRAIPALGVVILGWALLHAKAAELAYAAAVLVAGEVLGWAQRRRRAALGEGT